MESLVAAGMGIAIVPASVQDLQRRGVSYRPLSDPSAVLPLFLAIARAPDPSR